MVDFENYDENYLSVKLTPVRILPSHASNTQIIQSKQYITKKFLHALLAYKL